MAYSESLAARIRQLLPRNSSFAEKKMFGGVGFLLNGNMLVGVWKDSLIVRLSPELAEKALKKEHVRPMDITGKPMKGWLLIEPEGMEQDESLADWIEQARSFVKTLPKK